MSSNSSASHAAAAPLGATSAPGADRLSTGGDGAPRAPLLALNPGPRRLGDFSHLQRSYD